TRVFAARCAPIRGAGRGAGSDAAVEIDLHRVSMTKSNGTSIMEGNVTARATHRGVAPRLQKLQGFRPDAGVPCAHAAPPRLADANQCVPHRPVHGARIRGTP